MGYDYDEAAKDWVVVKERVDSNLRVTGELDYYDYLYIIHEPKLINDMKLLIGRRVVLNLYLPFFNSFMDGIFDHFSGVSGFDRYLVTEGVLNEIYI
jgi:hypothetical protein